MSDSQSRYIGEALPESKVTIRAVHPNGNAREFKTEAVLSLEDDKTVLYVAPLKEGDKYYNFDGVQTTAEVIIGSMVYRYALSSMILVKRDGELYHKCTCHAKKLGVNRRTAIRVPFFSDGHLQLGANHKVVDCTFVDISYSGTAIIIKEIRDLIEGDLMSLTFTHGDAPYRCAGFVARSQIIEEKESMLIGLRFNADYAQIRRLVSTLQRQDLQKFDHDQLRRTQ